MAAYMAASSQFQPHHMRGSHQLQPPCAFITYNLHSHLVDLLMANILQLMPSSYSSNLWAYGNPTACIAVLPPATAVAGAVTDRDAPGSSNIGSSKQTACMT